MDIEQAIVTALAYENRVRDQFRDLAEKSADPRARQFFEVMTREEQGHVDYLEAKLAQWRREGKIAAEELATAVPSKEWLARGSETLQAKGVPADRTVTREHLFAALKLEHEVSDFYRRLVGSVGRPDAERMFRRFLEIEDGHTALVQAQIDYETHTGHFFDFQEFTLDG